MLLPFHAPSPALPTQQGAINLSSAMVGAVLASLLGGVAAASATPAIPAAQDMAAQQNAAEVRTAQHAARTTGGSYLDEAGLEDSGYISIHRNTLGPRRYLTRAGDVGACFVVVSRSATSAVYIATESLAATPLRADDTDCLTRGEVQDMVESLESAAVS
jgi:type II secretory pathway pseudopilin PulG